MPALAVNSGSSHADCATRTSVRTPHTAHQRAAMPDTRTTINSRMSATNSALFNTVKTTAPTSSATGRVISGAEKRAGVASSETPAVMPNHVKQIHAGDLRANLIFDSKTTLA